MTSVGLAATGVGLLSTIIAVPVALGLQAGAIVCGLLGAGEKLVGRRLHFLKTSPYIHLMLLLYQFLKNLPVHSFNALLIPILKNLPVHSFNVLIITILRDCLPNYFLVFFKNLPVHSFSALIIPILRDCLPNYFLVFFLKSPRTFI